MTKDRDFEKEFDGELDDDLDTIIGSDIYRGLNGRKNLTDIIKGSQIDSSTPLINEIINNDFARIPASLYGERSNSITDFMKDTLDDIPISDTENKKL